MLLKSSHADSIFSKCCVYSRLSEVMQLAASASRGKTGLGGLETTSWLGKLAHPLSRSGLLGACLKFLTFASVGLFESGSFLLHFRLVRRRLASIVMGPRLPCVFARAHCVFHLSVFGCEMIRQIATARFPAFTKHLFVGQANLAPKKISLHSCTSALPYKARCTSVAPVC